MRVHDRGNGVVVDMAEALFDEFDGRNAFFLRFVCEHGAKGTVAYDADVGDFGAVLFIDYEAAFVVNFEANVFETKAGCVGAAANGHEDDVGVELGEDQ